MRCWKKCRESKTFWSLVCFHLCFGSYVRGGFGPEVCLWDSEKPVSALMVWDEEKPSFPRAEPSRVVFFVAEPCWVRKSSASGERKEKKKQKTKKLVLPTSPSTCRKCSRTPAVLAPLSGSGRPCGPPCSRSPFQAAAAWGRTRWPRSGWSYGFPRRGRSLWRNRGETNQFS